MWWLYSWNRSLFTIIASYLLHVIPRAGYDYPHIRDSRRNQWLGLDQVFQPLVLQYPAEEQDDRPLRLQVPDAGA